MKVFVVLAAVLACGMSQYIHHPYSFSPYVGGYGAYPYAGYHYSGVPAAPVVHAPVVVPTSSQYHAQDELGQFTFGTAGDNQARVETKRFDGTVTGAYSYVDPNGKLINVNYLADHNGFRVVGANNLPESPAVPATPALVGPEPVQDTPEVVAAKADFMKAFAEAKAAAEAAPEMKSRRRRQAVFYSSLFAPTTAVAKSTLKYNTFEPVDAAVPADTKKIELKEKETEVLTHVPYVAAPVAYSAVVPHVIRGFNYGFSSVHHPFAYHY